ncbi:MAG: hypothetical protein ACK5MU_03585 [Candidatus Saccharimonadales bacterium]
MFKNYAVSSMETRHSKERVDRQRNRRRSNTSIIVCGVVCEVSVVLLDKMSVELLGAHSFEQKSWMLFIAGATLIIYAVVEFVRGWLWQDDDQIYEREIERLSNK